MADKVAQNIGEFSYYFLDRQVELFYTFFNAEIDFYGYQDYEGDFVDLRDVEDFGEGTQKWTERWGFYWMIRIFEEIRELDIFENRSMAMAEQNTPGKQLVPV